MQNAESYRPLAERLLAAVDGWTRIGADTRAALLGAGRLHDHPAGRRLQSRGAETVELLFVVTGNLEVSTQSDDGRRAICWYLEPGQFVGMVPLIDGQGGIHDISAHADCVLLHIPKASFMAALRSDHILMETILRVVCARSRAMYETAAAETLLTLKRRTARLLGMLADRHGRPGAQGIELALKLSQDELAGMLGVSRQSLNKELKALEAAGAVSLAYSRIVVTDCAELVAIAGGASHSDP